VAKAARVDSPNELRTALDRMGLGEPRPVVLLIGGAGGLSEGDQSTLRPLFEDSLAAVIDSLGAVAVDGGTDVGVMRLLGRARAKTAASFPLVGVVARGTVELPGDRSSSAEAVRLEANHTHFVLVPGDRWGDESPWLDRVASALAQGRPSVAVVVNGGDTAWADAEHSVAGGRPIIAATGTGRAADALSASARGEQSDPRAAAIAATGLLQAVDTAENPRNLSAAVERALTRGD